MHYTIFPVAFASIICCLFFQQLEVKAKEFEELKQQKKVHN